MDRKCIIKDCKEFPMMEPPPPYNGSLNSSQPRQMCELHHYLLIRWVFNFYGRDLAPDHRARYATPAQLRAVRAEEERLANFRRAGEILDLEVSYDRPRRPSPDDPPIDQISPGG